MRVLMLTPAFHPRVGGVERHVRRVSEELAVLGHQVTVVTRAEPGAPLRELLGAVEVVRVRGGIRALPGLLRQHRDLFRQADVIHCHDAYPFVYWYAPMRLLARVPRAFVTFHGYEAWPLPPEAVRIRRWVRRACAGAVCVGEFISRWYGTPCETVTYGGVDLPPGLAPSEPELRAVFVGRLEGDTGVLEYVRMLALLREKHGVRLPLDVCGDGSLRDEVAGLARDRGVCVRLHGRVAEPWRVLWGARFALVSGYLAMWEAMGCGALVVALHDNPLKRDYLQCFPPAAAGDGSAVVEVCGSAEEAAGRVAWLLSRPEVMRDRAERGVELAAQRPWRRVAEEYLALWRRALASGGAARDGLGDCGHGLSCSDRME